MSKITVLSNFNGLNINIVDVVDRKIIRHRAKSTIKYKGVVYKVFGIRDSSLPSYNCISINCM